MYWLQSQSRLPVDLCSKRVGFNSDDPRYISSLANLSSSLQKLSMQPEGSHVDGAERADALAIAKASVAIEERWQDLTLIPFEPTQGPYELPPALSPLVRRLVRRARRVGALGDERHPSPEVLLFRSIRHLRREIVRALRKNALTLKKTCGQPYGHTILLRKPCRYLKGNRVVVRSFVNASFNAVVRDVGGFPAPLLCEKLKRPKLWNGKSRVADCVSGQEEADYDDVQILSRGGGSEEEGSDNEDEGDVGVEEGDSDDVDAFEEEEEGDEEDNQGEQATEWSENEDDE